MATITTERGSPSSIRVKAGSTWDKKQGSTRMTLALVDVCPSIGMFPSKSHSRLAKVKPLDNINMKYDVNPIGKKIKNKIMER